ncbi:MAG: metallophosphoesterase [Nitrososphaeria archaeon]
MLDLSRRRLLYASAASMLGIGLGLGFIETKRMEVTRLDVGVGAKIAFLVDLHINVLGDMKEDMIRLLDEEEPDMIMLGGDTVDELTLDFETVSRCLAALKAREKFAVMGNHEYWSHKSEKLAKILEDQGFIMLYDSTSPSMVRKVHGIDWREDRNYPHIQSEGIVLVHDPNAAESVSGKSLILSGHTHGGVVINGMEFSNSIYARGLHRLDGNRTLYVSRGLGQMFPWRLTAPLELVMVE